MTTADELLAEVREIKRDLGAHIEREDDLWRSAFPNGDIAGHRHAHEAMIEAAQEQAKFWRELKTDLAKKSAWGIIVLVFALVGAGGLMMVATKLGMASVPLKP